MTPWRGMSPPAHRDQHFRHPAPIRDSMTAYGSLPRHVRPMSCAGKSRFLQDFPHYFIAFHYHAGQSLPRAFATKFFLWPTIRMLAHSSAVYRCRNSVVITDLSNFASIAFKYFQCPARHALKMASAMRAPPEHTCFPTPPPTRPHAAIEPQATDLQRKPRQPAPGLSAYLSNPSVSFVLANLPLAAETPLDASVVASNAADVQDPGDAGATWVGIVRVCRAAWD